MREESIQIDEETVLGHMLRFTERVPEIIEGLHGNEFFSQRNRAVFEEIEARAGEGFDVLVLSKALKAARVESKSVGPDSARRICH